MDRHLRAFFDKSLEPNRAQHLVVSDSKHLFFYEKDEIIRYQQKELDHRTCGARRIVTRVIAIDEDTGVLYGELWPRDEELDLVGFLARAWSRKRDHPMRGLPSKLYAPSRVLDDKRLAQETSWCASVGGVVLQAAPGGFGAATVAAREYERQIRYAIATNSEFVLRAAHMAAPVISYLACRNAIASFAKQWVEVSGPPAATLEVFDAAYEENGAWRMDDFERFIVADGT